MWTVCVRVPVDTMPAHLPSQQLTTTINTPSNLLIFDLYRHNQPNPPTIKMQFSMISLVAALAASTTSAAYIQTNYTSVAYPTGTGVAAPSGTGSPARPTGTAPFTGAASVPQAFSGSALGLVIAGGVALVSFCQSS
ncbi:hypothetical protein J1614_011960 [Plenodomus biglobosus]|nr:hypothetical protein J1614_011960 [Plenodomus biglobosus]